MKHLTVTAAILRCRNEILCMQRNQSKFDYVSHKFEFPGGKAEAGESFEQCLSRELLEEMELSIIVVPEQFYMTVEHTYPDFSITMHSYLIDVDSKIFTRKEHVDHKWLKPEELLTLDWAPADQPIVKKIVKDLVV